MARTLETLDLGTAVYCGEARVGDVRGLYAEGSARSVEWIVVRWDSRGDVAVPAMEVGTIEPRGVQLLNADPNYYADLSEFEETRFPTVHKIA
jgi:hypothetical protein